MCLRLELTQNYCQHQKLYFVYCEGDVTVLIEFLVPASNCRRRSIPENKIKYASLEFSQHTLPREILHFKCKKSLKIIIKEMFHTTHYQQSTLFIFTINTKFIPTLSSDYAPIVVCSLETPQAPTKDNKSHKTFSIDKQFEIYYLINSVNNYNSAWVPAKIKMVLLLHLLDVPILGNI